MNVYFYYCLFSLGGQIEYSHFILSNKNKNLRVFVEIFYCMLIQIISFRIKKKIDDNDDNFF